MWNLILWYCVTDKQGHWLELCSSTGRRKCQSAEKDILLLQKCLIDGDLQSYRSIIEGKRNQGIIYRVSHCSVSTFPTYRKTDTQMLA
jgi:hypothetical protein